MTTNYDRARDFLKIALQAIDSVELLNKSRLTEIEETIEDLLTAYQDEDSTYEIHQR